MNNGWNRIVQHDAVKKFPLEDNSIDVCITSPPYWGLRNYGEQVKSIFGGDPKCNHVFTEYHSKLAHENRQNLDGGTVGNDKFREKLHGFGNAKAGFCQKCGAWQGQLGLEPYPQMFVNNLVMICQEIKRVLKKSGSFYLNLGDTYSSKPVGRFTGGGKEFTGRNIAGIATSGSIDKTKSGILQKSLCLIPSRVAIALVDDGWILRNDIIWYKPNPMPSSAKDRLKNTFDHVFHFVKSRKYFFDLDAIREPHKAESLERAEYGFNVIPRAWKEGAIPVSGGKNVNIDCHPVGKNPGDIFYNSKYKEIPVEISSENKLIDKVAYERKILGIPHDLAASHPLGRNPGDFWEICTQPFTGYNPDLEHFATFPEKLLLKPLMATCPKEICKKCGKPRTRITKTSYIKRWNRSSKEKQGNDGKVIDGFIHPNYGDFEGLKKVTTVGWTKCKCNAGFESSVVLDPFAGRGTVGKVAKQLGLHYILFDIKPEYCELACLYVGGQKHKLIKYQQRLN